MDGKRRARSTLPAPAARRRYEAMGGLAALEQTRRDAEALDAQGLAIGPFARIDAAAVAAQDGKTRGAITNLYGSQASYRVAAMELALDAGDWVEAATFPVPQDFATADEWVEVFFAGQSARGPRHGAEPEMGYASLWALWLGVVPYGLWSERVAAPSMEEYGRWVARLEDVFGGVLAHFGLALREGVALADLAAGAMSLTEGVWLNQCLTAAHPRRPGEPVSAALVRAGRLLWHGAVST